MKNKKINTNILLNPLVNIQNQQKSINSETLMLEGNYYFKQSKFPEAKRIYELVLQKDPFNIQALDLLGVISLESKEYIGAIELMKRILEINPRSSFALNNIGVAYLHLKDYANAINFFNKVIEIDPDYVEALLNLGTCYQQTNNLDAAIKYFDLSILKNPSFYESYFNKANALVQIKEYFLSLDFFEKTLKLNPNHIDAIINKGISFQELGRFEEAKNCFETAYNLKPNYNFLLGTLLTSRARQCEWANLESNIKKLGKLVINHQPVAIPFSYLSLIDNPELHRLSAKIYSEYKYPIINDKYDRSITYKENAKIKIGYYSADFYNHATGYLIAELFEKHDKDNFEFFAFSYGDPPDDHYHKRIKSALNFYDVTNINDTDVAKLSHNLGIDIAIDLKGYTDRHRVGIFANRCAPLQINYLGYPGTMGSGYYDYIIADKVIIPVDYQKYYTEKILYLPICYQVNDSTREISSVRITKEMAGLPKDAFIFCCFNNNYKIMPYIFDIWMQILLETKDSVLWLLEDNKTASDNLKKEAEIRGVNPNRLIFAERAPLDEHLSRHDLADLFIDTSPYNAHTTASDALWSGLPVLTCPGISFASRVSASLLNDLNLHELIAVDFIDYKNKAIDFAFNPEKIKNLKFKLNNEKMNSSLFKGEVFAKYIESAYTEIYKRMMQKQKPEHLIISNALN